MASTQKSAITVEPYDTDDGGFSGSGKCTRYLKYRNQFFAAMVACLTAMSIGTWAGYNAPTIDTIQRQFSLNVQEVSLIASLGSIGAIPGGFLGGPVADYFGRKLGLMLNCVVHAVGWLLIVCAQNVYMHYAGRFIGGFGVAMSSLFAPLYITEIASPEIRGILGMGFQVSLGLGILYDFALGAWVSWRYLAVAGLAVSAVQIVLMIFVPETPVWLARHNLQDEVNPVLEWLNRSVTDSAADKLSEKEKTTSEVPMTLKSFLEPSLLKPLGILFTLMFIQQFSGYGAVLLYAVSIFKSATDAIDANLSAIIIACSMLAATCLASVVVDRLGRRILLVVSGVLMAVGMISLATYYYVQSRDASSAQNIAWLPVVSLFIYEFAYGIGFGPVPWLMMGEVFPNRARGLASGIVTAFAYTTAFAMTKTFLDMRNAMTDYGVFWMFGAVCVFAVFFSYFIVPETKGKTFDEIELQFKGSKSR